jgi:hypothetical protein
MASDHSERERQVAHLTAASQLAQKEISPVLRDVLVRLVSSDAEGTVFQPHATASLFAIGRRRVLVTAGHVLDDPSLPLWAEDEIRQMRVTLAGQRWRNKDADLGLVEVGDELAAMLAGMRMLTLADMQLEAPSGSRFALSGFPQELNRGEKNVLGYLCSAYRGPTTGIDFDPDVHLLFTYDLSFSAGEDGTSRGLPDSLKGMSGCPVWLVDPARPSVVRLVAIQTATVPVEGAPHLRVVKATRCRQLLANMRQAFPEIEPALAEWRARRLET